MKIFNRYFKSNYEPLDKFEVGIILTGPEVKSIRLGNLKIENAFAKIIDSEVWLFNAEISNYSFSTTGKFEPTRKKKLLLHKKDILKIETKLKSGGRLTLAPELCYTKGRLIKISLALCKGRGEIAKKKIEMKEDIKREQQREMKEYVKRQTVNSKRQTANSKRQTVNSKRQTVNGKRQTVNSKQ